ncbi:iron ABC transporter substrate-binding protein [Smaragdicoccus niigatensis]|uniref:iron ABC transporter substrate-binding protein n=1 Tax=Smaragdicoccus niigatensis TaxID=359359 RepID=UPI0003687E55|nr:iron ABC transporter substrate-binding protein [Smaragdicoccus niigatensis]
MVMNRRHFFVTAAAVTAAAGLAACSKGETSGGGSTKAKSITVYSGQHESLTNEWVEAFKKETGIDVAIRRAGDIELANQLVAEGDASPADVFLTENSPAMALVENAGLFAGLDQATLNQVPEAYRPSTGKWTGAAARSTVFAYNKDKLTEDQLPKSIFDLQKPEWKGRWSAATNADFQAIMAAMLELKGADATESWLKSLKNDGTAYQNNIAVYQNVNSGQVEGGVTFHYYWFQDQAKTGDISNNVKLHYFKHEDPGAFVSVSGAGVLKGSKNAEAAQQFVAFVTGPKGQAVLSGGDVWEYPVGNGAKANPKLPPLASLEAPKVDTSKFDSKKVTELMTQAGLL